jgi:hypothetical protein
MTRQKSLTDNLSIMEQCPCIFIYRADDSELGELEGVAEMEEDLATGRVTLFPKPVSDILHLVTAHAQQCKFPLDSLYLKQGSLEQVFRHITQKKLPRGECVMSKISILFRREFSSFFATPFAYVFIGIFLILSSVFTFFVGGLYERGQADLLLFLIFILGYTPSW